MKYSIEGAPLPVVICDLEAGESMITERSYVLDDAKHEDGDIRRRNGKNDWSYV